MANVFEPKALSKLRFGDKNLNIPIIMFKNIKYLNAKRQWKSNSEKLINAFKFTA